MKASDVFVKALENEGVCAIFGVPGEENLDLVESLRTSSIQLIVTHHEQAAGFMAATYGRLTGKIGVCLSTLGPGATNLVTAAAYAQLGAMPMLMVTGQKPIKKSKQGKFQIVDIVEMMRPLTKFTKQIVHAHTIPPLIRNAVRIAQQERPGAVHLELPEDIAQENCECPLFAIEPIARPVADTPVIKQAAKLISQAKHPLLLIGAGANRTQTSQALTDFIKKTGIYFFTTQMGKGVVDERHPSHLGTAALSENDYLHCAIEHADLIINVGHDIVEKPPFLMKHDKTAVIHINFFSANIDDVYFPTLEVIGDITHTITQLSTLVDSKAWEVHFYQAVHKAFTSHIQSGCRDPRYPMIPQRLVADAREAIPSEGIITLDNGMYKIWFSRNYTAHLPNTLLLDNALATMGAGLPSAIAVKLVYPERPVISICGDGGFMMSSHELATAVRLKLDLIIIILRDNAFGMIKWKQQGMGFADFGLDLQNPDFVKLAESFGAQGYRLEKSDDFIPLLKQLLKTAGVHLIELAIDYSESHDLLAETLPKKIKTFMAQQHMEQGK